MSESSGKATIISSLIVGLFGGSFGAAAINFFSSSSIEEQKFTYSLINQALETEEPGKRLDRLNFMNELGLFDSSPDLKSKVASKINQAKDNPDILPQLPPSIPPASTPQETRGSAIVIGSDSSHTEAIDEVRRAANNGYPNAQIYLRQGRWRTIILFGSLQLADAALAIVRNFSYNKDAFKIDLNIWCSSQTQSEDNVGSFIECKE